MLKAHQEVIDKRALLYRVGKSDSLNGLWYDKNGSYTGLIHNLSEGNAALLPMGPHPIFRTDGHHWISTTDSLEMLKNWFSEQDMTELTEQGYELLKIEVSGYRRFHFEGYSHEVYSDHQLIHINAIDPGILYKSLADDKCLC